MSSTSSHDRDTSLSPTPDDVHSLVGRRISHYKLRRLIATGGMGSVYEAVQDKPQRTVAVKVMKRGLASRSALRRFEYESQILARLRHPGIAQVYEAGTHDDGSGAVPYFVMEYVPNARTLIQFAQTKGLGTRDRLDLFTKVCHAVHHGHQKGIIHRDLKPANILVDSSGEPKIIDFGVARSSDSDLAVTTLQTDVGQLVGTLQYMSPEQCDADPHDLDTRSDIYALGVVLYELLCEKLPYDVTKAAVHEAVQVVREATPVRLSTVDRALRGDLETITLKALEKERDRRYQSAIDLAQDLRRYMDDEPILASPPSATYRMRKFIRRHRAGVTAAALVLVAIVLGAAASTVGFVQASREREIALANADEATTEAARTTAVVDLMKQMLSSADPHQTKGPDYTVRQLLDEFAAGLGNQLEDQPRVEATIQAIIGISYKSLGSVDAAELHLRRAEALRRRVLGAEHPATLRVMNELAGVIRQQAKYRGEEKKRYQAESMFLETLEISRRVLGAEHLVTVRSMQGLSLVYNDLHRWDDAEPLLLEALEILERTRGKEHLSTLWTMGTLAGLQADAGRADEAEPLFLEAIEIQRRVLGEEHPTTLQTMYGLFVAYGFQRRYDEAERLALEVLELHERAVGLENPSALSFMNNLTSQYLEQGRYDDAEPHLLRMYEISKDLFDDDNTYTFEAVRSLSFLYRAQGRHDEALRFGLEGLEIQRRALGREHPTTLVSMNMTAIVYAEQGRYDEAESLHLETLDIRRRVLGEHHPDTLASRVNLAALYAEQGRDDEAQQHYDDAEQLYRDTLEILRRDPGVGDPRTRSLVTGLASLYERQARLDEALALRRELLEHEIARARDEGVDAGTKNDLAWKLLTHEDEALRDPAVALELALEAVGMREDADPASLDTLALAYHMTGDSAKAVETQSRAIEMLDDDDRDGRVELEGRLAEFEAALRESDAKSN